MLDEQFHDAADADLLFVVEASEPANCRRREAAIESHPQGRIASAYRFFFFSNEGFEPPHIHVEKGDSHAKWWLEQPAQLAYSEGFSPSPLRRMRELVAEHQDEFNEAWYEYFHHS